MKKLIAVSMLALLASACIVPPHFDENPIPAKDYIFMPAGVVLDGGAQLLKLPTWLRIALDITVPLAVRIPAWGGHHYIDSGFGMVIGEGVAAIGGGIITGLNHSARNRRCEWQSHPGGLPKDSVVVDTIIHHGCQVPR